VIDECSAGDSAEIAKRLAAIEQLKSLELTDDSDQLAKMIISSGVLPRRAIRDAAHIAIAAAHKVDYLLTWNCKHLANAQLMRRISLLCDQLGQQMPIICTPEELMGE
jgi:hypothetical protein